MKHMNSNKLNKVVNIYIPNAKGLLINDNTSPSDNIAINTKVSSSLIYSHNKNNNSLVKKSASETTAKRTTVCSTKKDTPISLENTVIANSDTSSTNQAMISNASLYLGETIFNDTMNNSVTVNKKY